MCHSIRNHKPHKRLTFTAIQAALQTAIIATATTMFLATTQLINFPIVFETPLSCKGLVQLSFQMKLNRPDLCINAMDKGEWQQLRYVQQMDELIEGLMADPNNTAWNITQILSHRIYKQHGKRQLLVKIQWINDSNTWECSEAI